MHIKIDLKIFIVVLIFLLTRQIEVYLALMLFAIIHEIGHLLMGIILGFKPKKIEILPVGVSACFYMNSKDYNKKVICANILTIKKLCITIAGPLTNFMIAIIFCLFNIKILGISREQIVYANMLIGIFNLIPIYPLDGGRIIKSLVHLFKGLKKSYKYTYIISNITIILLTAVSSIGILYFENIAILLILVYLWMLVIIQNKRYNSKMNIYKLIEELDEEKKLYKN